MAALFRPSKTMEAFHGGSQDEEEEFKGTGKQKCVPPPSIKFAEFSLTEN